MKKVFLGLGIIAGTTITLAQNSTLKFGIKAGLNISSISKDGYDDTKAKAGFNAGGFMNVPLSDYFSIQPEVLYNQMGSSVTKNFTLNNLKYSQSAKLNLDYITVPVMFQLKATPNFYIEAGPEFGFLVSAKASNFTTTNLSGGTSTTSTSENIKDNFNSFNMGVGGGLGFKFDEHFGINARYVFGFTDINKNGNTSLQNSQNKNRNNTFQVGVSYAF